MHRPSRPDVELSADTEVYITWDIPEQMPITLEGVAYRLEIRQVGEGTMKFFINIDCILTC